MIVYPAVAAVHRFWKNEECGIFIQNTFKDDNVVIK